MPKVAPCLPVLHKCLSSSVVVEWIRSSTICKIRSIPDCLADELVEELRDNPDAFVSIAGAINPNCSPDSVLWNSERATIAPLTLIPRLDPPPFEQPLQIRHYEVRPETTQQSFNSTAKLQAKWMKILRHQVWGLESSFIFVYVRENQPLRLRLLYERKRIERNDTDQWVAHVIKHLRNRLPNGYAIEGDDVQAPRGVGCWFLVTWHQRLSRLASQEVRRFLLALNQQFVLYQYSIPANN
jgi:hypothetical protein